MRLRNYDNLTDAERKVATPKWDRLLSLGEQTRMIETFTSTGVKQTAQPFEVFVEYSHCGWGERRWHRYPNDPSVLVFQGDLTPTREGPPEGYEPYTDEELKIIRANLKPTPDDTPTNAMTPITSRPDW